MVHNKYSLNIDIANHKITSRSSTGTITLLGGSSLDSSSASSPSSTIASNFFLFFFMPAAAVVEAGFEPDFDAGLADLEVGLVDDLEGGFSIACEVVVLMEAG